MPRIDIVIPVYNHSQKIIACLKSIQSQTFKDFSVFIVDDGSNDGVFGILEAYLRAEAIRSKDPENDISSKTKVMRQKHLGASAARNRGARECLSEFILFCDADVVLHKKFLEKTIDALEKNENASYVYTSFRYGWKKFPLWEFDEKKLREIPYIHTTSLMRKKHFLGFDENLKRFQDWDLWLTMLEHGYRGVWIPEVLFRVSPGGTMSKWLPKAIIKYFPSHKKVQSYNYYMNIVKKKHNIV